MCTRVSLSHPMSPTLTQGKKGMVLTYVAGLTCSWRHTQNSAHALTLNISTFSISTWSLSKLDNAMNLQGINKMDDTLSLVYVATTVHVIESLRWLHAIMLEQGVIFPMTTLETIVTPKHW